MTDKPCRAEEMLGGLAPKMVELTDGVLFGDVWKHPGLSPRDRSLVSSAPLTSPVAASDRYPAPTQALTASGRAVMKARMLPRLPNDLRASRWAGWFRWSGGESGSASGAPMTGNTLKGPLREPSCACGLRQARQAQRS